MASNSFGNLFRITTWGETHGPAIGVVIDGCPPHIPITVEEINQALLRRAPGTSPYVSPRNEPDKVEILSGVFECQTTGAPISLLIKNCDARTSAYEPLKELHRPGHAGYTYLEKYGIYDWRGSGRASARETACRVAASVLAKKVLEKVGIKICAYLACVGDRSTSFTGSVAELQSRLSKSSLFCPSTEAEEAFKSILQQLISVGDSIGGQVVVLADGLPPGLGDPIYEKLEARLGFAMMGLPASRAFEIGEGVHSCIMNGSKHNDAYEHLDGKTVPSSNHAGGVLAGISTGQQLNCRVTFKPASSIRKSQTTVTYSGQKIDFTLPEGSRHDPCVAIRAVPVVEAMTALVLADALMMQRASSI